MPNEDQQLELLKRRSIHGVFSYFLRTLALQAVGFVALIFLSQFLSPSDFGIYGLVTQIIGLLIFFSDVGLAAVLIQKKFEPTLAEYRAAFTLQQVLSWLIVLVVVLLLSSNILDQKIGAAGQWLLLALAFSFPLATLKTIPSIMLERELNFSKLVIPQMFEQVVFYGIVVVMAWQGMGVMAYTYAVIFRSLIGVLVMNLLKPWAVGLNFNQTVLRSLLQYGIKFQLNDFLARIKDQLFYLAVGLYLPNREFGLVTWAKNWSMYPYQLTVQNIMTVTFPTFSRIQHQKQLLARAIEKSIFTITLVIFPIITGMSLFIGPLTHVFVGFQKWQPAVLSFILFCLSIAWAAISTPLTNTLNALGKINTTLKLMLFWSGLTWVLTPVALVLWGFNGIAIASFAISLTSVLVVILTKKVIPFRFFDQVWRQVFASSVMAVCGLLSLRYISSKETLLLSMVFVATVYFVSIILIGRGKIDKELRPIWQTLRVKMIK